MSGAAQLRPWASAARVRCAGRIILVIAACLVMACGPAPSPSPTSPAVGPAETSAAGSSAAPAARAVDVADPTPAGPADGSQGPGATTPSKPARSVSGEITVFAAASLTDAFREIGERFQAANPNARVAFNFGASSQLRTQLEQGARADVFASANQQEMDRAKAVNVIGGADRTFAHNRLAVIFPRSNPAGITELKDLARPGLKLVTAGPEVPIGVYTQDMLEKMSRDAAFGAGFRERVNANVVSREPNVRQVAAKVHLGEADAAVVYTSDVGPDLAANLGTLEVPDRFNTPASYPIAVVRHAPNGTGAEAFVSYVLGPEGQAVLKKWGFISAS